MQWFTLILVFAALATASPVPEPKKYKPEIKDIKTNSSLSNEEKQFLREVEAKFGIKPDVPIEAEKTNDNQTTKLFPKGDLPKLPFPAVIAIEIVNDTDSKSKGKRTIDANLGYGYRTNNGYSYSYFGKSSQEKGKFMLYPYSQEDIPPAQLNNDKTRYSKHEQEQYKTSSQNVEIQPSQAYELVPVKEEQPTSYEYKRPLPEFKSQYENVKGLQSPPPPYRPSQNPSSTLYTTYNGENFSGLSGQFPTVMSNYFVDSSQLLKHPEYQNAGLTQDHLRTHGSQLEQRVVPVLVLRIPSSYIKNPSAELYANLPQNYPLSQYLNNVNLQELVNQYFSKIGYSNAPQIKSYPHSSIAAPAAVPNSAPVTHYGRQHYSNPYVRPSYTQADYSGVQYSAVQPVMAKYPSSYPAQQYYMTQQLYTQPIQQQQYEYQYQYVPPAEAQQQYYVNAEYQQEVASPESHSQQSAAAQEPNAHTQYDESQSPTHAHAPPTQEYEIPKSANYRPQQLQSQQYVAEQPEYELPKGDSTDYSSKDNSPTNVQVSAYRTPKPEYGAPQEEQQHQQYYTPNAPVQKETVALFPSSPQSQTIQKHHVDPQSGLSQSYFYQKQVSDDSASKTIVISENYPSQDHTIATVLPLSYKSKKQGKPSVQTVSYVTPVPSKFQSQYNVMVPQTVLKGPTTENVSYVNSHSLPLHYLQSGAQYNPEEEYSLPTRYIPARGSQKPLSYPRNYHSQPKRMVKSENKPESATSSLLSSSRKRNEKNDKKKSS